MQQQNLFGENPALIRVVSKRKGGIAANANEMIIPVDRTHPVLGNKHILHNYRDRDERNAVIDAYARDLEADCAVRGPMFREIQKIAELVGKDKPIALQCWCSPAKCHADLLLAKILSLHALKTG